ncbi:MAG: D-tyrosyl-tRNA(Tyr) deacylase [Actinomycetia bacterium]|nr:D-tyrosyl-tRNA(Tyr) deacylase [Actinomycetes bacterium]MCP5030893.1 D-tyrosyl-tRNA(Tyr) deacylase [Actinomycetes bacterium]
MRAVVQRVAEAEVTVEGERVGSIGAGLCVLVGVTHGDTEATSVKLATRLAKLRIFADDDDKMNRSVLDIGGQVLVISQFTLYGDTRKGNRPGYSDAAAPEVAEPLIIGVVDELRSLGIEVETGRFGANMDVRLVNQGPVTLQLDIPA